MTITVNVPVELDDQFFEDIIVTMLEGGSNYWVDSIDIGGEKPKGMPYSMWAAQAINSGGAVRIYPKDYPDVYRLTKEKLIKGVQMWINTHKYASQRLPDAGDIDAGDADSILQFALFGELVFG